MKRVVTLTAVAVLALGLSGNAMAEKRGLVVATSQGDAGKLDPHQTAQGADKGILNWMFNGLVRIRPGEVNPEFIEPDLAVSWSSNDDGTEWAFTIRDSVTCHDGSSFTAEDAAYSLRRASDKETSSFAGDYASFDSIEATDSKTLRITLKNPIPSLLGIVANYHGGMMVCQEAAEAAGADFGKNPVGTGPFKFVEYRPQQYVKMAAHTSYFRGAPKLDTITYRYIPSDATRDLAFQSGEVDMVFGRQTNQWVERTKKVPGAVVVAMEPAELNQIYLNTSQPPLDDIRVRQAIAHAINREEMVAFTGDEVAREAVSIIPQGNLGLNRSPGLLDYNIDRAKQLLAEAGFPNGVTIKSVQSTLPVLLRIGEAVQAQLRKAGIELELEPVDHPTYHTNIRKDLSGVTLYQAARFPVADVYLTNFFHSRSTVNTPTGITNFSHCDAGDAEIDAARSETNLEKQKELWALAQKKIVDQVCSVPFSEQLVMWAWKDSLDFGYDVKGSLNLMPQITEQTRFTD